MLNTLSLTKKLPLMVASLAILSAIITGVVAYSIGSYELRIEAENKTTALVEARKEFLSYYLDTIKTDVSALTDNDMTVDGLTAFEKGWEELGDKAEATLQKLYIDDNPHPNGEKHKLDRAKDDSSYSKAHGHFHPWFRHFLEERGYYDVFLVNHEGKLVYSVFKERDYATNLITGKWKNTDLGKITQEVLANFKQGSVIYKDFAPYEPSAGAPAGFIAAPIFDDKGEKHGVLIFQMPVDRINAVMKSSVGLGETGETYLVGSDHLMRSDSRFNKNSTILKEKVDTHSVREAIAGKTGAEMIQGHLGTDVVSAYTPLDFMGVRWAVVAEIDRSEALNGATLMGTYMALSIIAIAVGVSILGYFLIRGTVSEIARSSIVLRSAASGDLDTRVMSITRQDEIGVLQGSINRLLDRTEAFSREAGAALKYAAKGEYFRTILPEGMVGSFAQRAEIINIGLKAMDEKTTTFASNAQRMGTNIKEVVQIVTGTASELSATSESMSEIANDTSEQSQTVSEAAQTAAENVQSVAAATEEFSASIGEVAAQVNRSAELGQIGVQRAKAADETIQSLSAAANRIGEVVGLINDIAEQTNLLALNATIEAARAGDAGKGFAVVASEVKNLANQTAKATEEIVEQINGMQKATGNAVKAIEEVGATIDEIDESGSTIAGAVDEQRAVVSEISSSIQSAVDGVRIVADTIARVSEGAGSTSSSLTQVTTAAMDLESRAAALNSDVEQFLDAVTKQ